MQLGSDNIRIAVDELLPPLSATLSPIRTSFQK